VKIHLKGGHLIDPANGVDARRDLYIAAGKVVAVGAAPDGFAANRTLDVSGCVVAPGLIDLSARLREPGFEYKATLESEMAAAVAKVMSNLEEIKALVNRKEPTYEVPTAHRSMGAPA
jgi:dihydroorotase